MFIHCMFPCDRLSQKNKHIVCVFGVYMFVLTCNYCPLQHWTKLQRAGGPWPKARSGHAACCINYGSDSPLLLVSGGLDGDGNTLKDAWLLNLNAGSWKEVGWLQCMCQRLLVCNTQCNDNGGWFTTECWEGWSIQPYQ